MITTDTPITKEQLGDAIDFSPTDFLSVKLAGVKGKEEVEFVLVISDTRGPAHYPSSEARRTFPTRFPERHEVPGLMGTSWRVPVTDISCQLIAGLWPQDRLAFDPDAKIMFDHQMLILVQQVVAMRRTAKYHEYIKWRNALANSEGMELMPLEMQDPDCAMPLALMLGKGDRLFATEEGLVRLPYPHEIAPPMVMGNGHTGMIHQSVGGHNSLNNSGYGYFFEPGTGKTSATIWRIDEESAKLDDEGRPYRAIIVVPNNIALNWEKEFKEFSRTPGSVTVLRGLVIDRIKMLIEALQNADGGKYVVIVCSYEILCNMWDYLGAIEWDLGVLDESHYIKWPYTKRAQHAFKLRDKCKARLPLTGTAVCNTAIDLFSQFEFMRKGGSGFSSFKAFQKFYGVYETVDVARNRRRLVDVQNLPFLRERLARMSMVVTRAEALPDLPEIQRDVVEVFMSPEQTKIYKDVQVWLIAEIESDMANASDRRTINAENILTKLLRLAQITSGFVAYDAVFDPETGLVESPKGINRIDPNPKIEAMMSLFKDEDGQLIKGPDQKTIIWACWVQDIRTIAARLKLENIEAVTFYGSSKPAERQEAERRFNEDPSCTVFIGNPGCGGVGLNLIGYPPRQFHYTTNCDHVIYFSQDWSHPKRVQSEMRANRMGTRVITRCTDLCVRRTIDEEIRERVLNKRTMAMKTQDLRDVLAKVLDMANSDSQGAPA